MRAVKGINDIFPAGNSYSETRAFSWWIMKKRRWLCFLLTIFVCLSLSTRCVLAVEGTENGDAAAETVPENTAVAVEAPSVLLMELSTGTVLFEKNADEQRSPASITKIMTLLLLYENLEKGKIGLQDEVTTSAYAKSMGGSQVYLEEGEKQTVETLIKCIVIASGNDASVTMAEYIAGSEEAFVKQMNEKAKELGMENTNFKDCCGLTDSTEHYTTARDVAIMSRELVSKYPDILQYSSIWMENITHVTKQGTSEFGLTNTNKLLRSYDGCLGLKTGSTSVAKYCVSAVAERNDMRMLAVVMGAPDPKGRFADAAALLNYGFGSCALYRDQAAAAPKPVKVKQGVKDEAACEMESEFTYVDTKGSDLQKIEKKTVYDENLKAPLRKGDRVGEVVYTLEGEVIGSVALVSKEDINKANYLDYLKKAGKEYFLY